MIFLVALLAAEGFRVVQYAPRPVALRGCAECRGEPDDVCEVSAGLSAQPIAEYLKARWPAPGRLKLIRSKAETDCAVQPQALLGARGALELAAVRVETALPSSTLLEKVGPPIVGWPRIPPKRNPAARDSPQLERAALREAIFCWPSERGWPSDLHGDARPLDANNRCQKWLVAVKPETGEPDLTGVSFPLRQAAFAYAPAPAARAAAAAPTGRDDPAAMALSGRAESGAAAVEPPPREAASSPADTPAAPCGDSARTHVATLDRFDQWDLQIRRGARASLDRASWTLDAAAWSGHCQELDVLRGVLEQQLSCAVAVAGSCSTGAR